MALELNLTKNTNDAIQGTLGKYYPRVEYKGTLSKADLAKHMHQHNAIYSLAHRLRLAPHFLESPRTAAP